MTSHIYHPRQANDILSRSCRFYFLQHQAAESARHAEKPSFCQVQRRGESGNEAARLALFHWGDRCDCLTRSNRTGCLLRGLTRLLRAPHGPSHLSGPFLALSASRQHRPGPHYRDLGASFPFICLIRACLWAFVCPSVFRIKTHARIYMFTQSPLNEKIKRIMSRSIQAVLRFIFEQETLRIFLL